MTERILDKWKELKGNSSDLDFVSFYAGAISALSLVKDAEGNSEMMGDLIQESNIFMLEFQRYGRKETDN